MDSDFIIDRAELLFTEGKSNKIYHLVLYKNGYDKYCVMAIWGRRDKTLSHQIKEESSSEYHARKVFKEFLSKKLAKGYRRNYGDYEVDEAMIVAQMI